MCSVEIRMYDDIYNCMVDWTAHHSMSKSSTHVVAGTNTGDRFSSNERNDDDEEEYVSMDDGVPKVYYIRPLLFTPAEGYHLFWYRCRPIFLIREEGTRPGSIIPTEKFYLKCFGRDTSIQRAILQEAQLMSAKRDKNKTVIFRGRMENRRFRWIRATARLPRLLSTVVLNQRYKDDFIEDIKEYLQPATRTWYANRGIPYRRGYLFFGPPGTGKTSLCIAAAGALDLKIYIINLSSMTGDGLSELCATLPRRCILLLEDVDTNSVTAARETSVSATQPDSPQAGALAEDNHNNGRQTISLSSILNAFDGADATEGRILVMTTNHLRTLDVALTRPGRIDMQIEFGYPDSDAIRRLFLTIYSPDKIPENHKFTTKTFSCQHYSNVSPPSSRPVANTPSEDRLEVLADKFAASVANREFSPADVQGYLLRHKNEPEVAVEGVSAWVENRSVTME
jgi:chaperone BCS1